MTDHDEVKVKAFVTEDGKAYAYVDIRSDHMPKDLVGKAPTKVLLGEIVDTGITVEEKKGMPRPYLTLKQ